MQAIGVLKMMNPAPLSPPYRTYVLDDHKFITEILTLQLNSDSHIDVVGIGNRGTAGIHFVKNHRVDIALVDMELDGDDGVHVAREMLEADPRIRVVGLSAHVANHYALALLEAGGDGDRDAGLLLEASQAELTPHLRTPGAALSGQIALSRASSLSQLSIPHILASIS